MMFLVWGPPRLHPFPQAPCHLDEHGDEVLSHLDLPNRRNIKRRFEAEAHHDLTFVPLKRSWHHSYISNARKVFMYNIQGKGTKEKPANNVGRGGTHDSTLGI